MNKKLIIMMIAALVAVSAMSGCGKKENAENATTQQTGAVESGEVKEEGSTEAADAEKKEEKAPEKAETKKPQEEPAKSENTKISNADATAKIQELVNNVMGKDAFVLPADNGNAKDVEIEGKTRTCYIFGAAKLDLAAEEAESTQVKNFYFDVNTGEIFEIAQDNSITKVN